MSVLPAHLVQELNVGTVHLPSNIQRDVERLYIEHVLSNATSILSYSFRFVSNSALYEPRMLETGVVCEY